MIVYSNFQNSSCTVQYSDKRIKQNPYFLDCIHSDHWYMFVGKKMQMCQQSIDIYLNLVT